MTVPDLPELLDNRTTMVVMRDAERYQRKSTHIVWEALIRWRRYGHLGPAGSHW